MSTLQDLIDPELIEPRVRIEVTKQFDVAIDSAHRIMQTPAQKLTTRGPAKSLPEFYKLVGLAIDDYETRQNMPFKLKVNYTEEGLDNEAVTETIAFSLKHREPGAFSRGAPLEGKVKNRRPLLREVKESPTTPGYRQAIMGYLYDNIICFTCWARTNKTANARADWLENLMEDYAWWFTLQGVQRVIYHGRDADKIEVVNENKWYGRPINFFVRTEKVRVFSEKTLEEIFIKLAVKRQ